MGITHHNRLSLSQTYDVVAGGTVLGVTGIAQITGTLVVTGSKNFKLTGGFTQTGGKVSFKSNGTGAVQGVRTVTTGGSASVSLGGLQTDSVIILTPAVNTAIQNVVCYERYSARTTGAAGKFRFRMIQGSGTAVTGRVFWTVFR